MADRVVFGDHQRGNEAILARMRAGDASAFESVILTYHDRLVAYLGRAGVSNDVADDVLQELYLRLWRNRETLPQHADLNLYLHTAIRHRLLDHVRSERRFLRATQRYGDHRSLMNIPFANSSDDAIGMEELERAILDAVDQLPPQMRNVWTLHREQGLSYAEVGERLGISSNTVKTHMRRALEMIRSGLRRLNE